MSRHAYGTLIDKLGDQAREYLERERTVHIELSLIGALGRNIVDLHRFLGKNFDYYQPPVGVAEIVANVVGTGGKDE